jgi:hypothetical protein
VSAAEGATFAWASVVITDGFIPGDHLAADAGGTRIAANYDSATGVLTLTGAATLAHYQQALRTVRYWRTGGDADHRVARARDIAWQVSDGVAWSVPQVTNLTIVAKPEPRPGTTGPAGAQTTPSGSASGSPRVSPRNRCHAVRVGGLPWFAMRVGRSALPGRSSGSGVCMPASGMFD